MEDKITEKEIFETLFNKIHKKVSEEHPDWDEEKIERAALLRTKRVYKILRTNSYVVGNTRDE